MIDCTNLGIIFERLKNIKGKQSILEFVEAFITNHQTKILFLGSI